MGQAPQDLERWVFEQILRWEGEGKPDAAGARFGIDPRFHPEVDVAHVTREEALVWYHEHVWEKWRLAELSPPLALVLADYYTNSGAGPSRVAKLLRPDPYDVLLDRWEYLIELAHGDISQDPAKLAEWRGAFLGWMRRLRENLVAVRRWEKENEMADSGSKPFYASRTLWVNLLAGLGALAQAQGWISTSIGADMQLALLGLVNVVLRIVTKERVSLS